MTRSLSIPARLDDDLKAAGIKPYDCVWTAPGSYTVYIGPVMSVTVYTEGEYRVWATGWDNGHDGRWPSLAEFVKRVLR